MNILFTHPLAFAALTALPVLAAIYLLRNRFRQFYVSSLILWSMQRRHIQGGQNIDRLQTPLLFLLELLILFLLAVAAAGPMLRSQSDTRRIVIVLDDSFSMLAKAETTCRQRAENHLKDYLKSSKPFRATFVKAGIEPVILADGVDNLPEALLVLDKWKCLSPQANLDKALITAGQIAEQKSRILLVSDHVPETVTSENQLQTLSFGIPLDNMGFLHADRTKSEETDRCLLTIGNFGNSTKSTRLTIKTVDQTEVLYDKQIEISPDEPFQMIFEAKLDIDLVASINDDALEIDNMVTLVAPERKKIRIGIDVADERLAGFVHQALDVIPDVRQVTEGSQMLITDKPLSESAGGLQLPWTLQFISDPNTFAFIGPFIMDRSHPLTEGLDLSGVIWSGSVNEQNYSTPVITAGNTCLLEDDSDVNDGHHLRLYLNQESSTLQLSPNWPIFFWNLVNWRKTMLYGINKSNYRLGSQIDFEVPPDTSSFQVHLPNNHKVNYDLPAKSAVISADMAGVYRITSNDFSYNFAVNAIAADESDIRASRTERIVNPDQATQFWWEYKSYDWIIVLICIALLLLHGYLIIRQ